VEFIEKENDTLHTDLEELIQDSKDAFLKSLFPGVAVKKNDIGSCHLEMLSTGSAARNLDLSVFETSSG